MLRIVRRGSGRGDLASGTDGADGFDSLYPKYSGGRPPTFTLPQRQAVKRVALSRPVDHGLPFSTWSLTKLAEFLVAEGVVDDISHEGLRDLLGKEGVSFQVIKTFKQSNDPDFEAKKNRVLELYDIADHRPSPGRATRRWCCAWTSSAANNVELAYVPTNASWLNRIEWQFTALRYFTLDATDHRSHEEQNSMIRRYIAWRNRHTDNEELRAVSFRANVA